MIDSFKGDYFFLSNFYEAPVEYGGIRYGNNEAAFQAQKCADEKKRLDFAVLNPTEAKKAGRAVELRKDWEDVKVSVMREIVEAKFDQNPELAEKFLATGDEYLAEGNDWGDRVWGTVDGSGANNLGRILMEVRERIRERVQEEPEHDR